MENQDTSLENKKPFTDEPQKILLVSRSILRRTHDYFLPYWRAGVETACFWFGANGEDLQVATTVAVPKLLQSPGNYQVDIASMRRLTAEMREQGITNLAQVHTHPIGFEVKHSWFDDERAYSTKNGALSLVWADYGLQMNYDLKNVGVHERQNGKWVLLNRPDVGKRIRLIDDFADFRWVIEGNWLKDEQ